MPEDIFLSVGSIILDDIVFPDGTTRMAVLGGGGTHAAMGMRVWHPRVGLVAAIGRQFPAAHLAALGEVFDPGGLIKREAPTPRAWQLYEDDGQRTEVFRTDLGEFIDLGPLPAELPNSYQEIKGAHLQCSAPGPMHSWIELLRARGCSYLLWEPWELYLIPENLEEIRRILPLVEVFSPGLAEARGLTGLEEPEAIVHTLQGEGAEIVALRMGAAGSLVGSPDGMLHSVPAVPVPEVVDVTGAGNAYCGGFLVGLAETGDPHRAGCYGAVSASLALAQFGALYPSEGIRAEAEARLGACKK
jgi:sugar/nucleoside kinase (ribokinase family)